ncbi:nucleotide disphospho-sugar-binding domain-containing protein [Actinomadura sp. NPDC048394]|uniref:nucleotide disphospho-sugar-binding domain-containing protein n=1 Tax=Actinomadura sp. NPDC048394 TaxID=3158223 RepID=UPI003405B786
MRVLMLSTPVSTHFASMVPVAWALRAAGHELVVAGQPDIAAAVRDAGMNYAVFGPRFHALDLLLPFLGGGDRPLQILGPATAESLASGTRPWVLHSRYLLPRYLEFARSWRPDLILSEQFEFAGLVIGGALGVPVVQHRWGVDMLAFAMRPAAEELLAGACERLRLARLPEPDLILDPTPPELQLPELPPAQPVRPVPFNGTGSLPGWVHEPFPQSRRVCVSLGNQTLALNGVPLLKNIIAALGRLPGVQAVVTAEPEYHAEIGTVPEHVLIVPPTPLSHFLHTCDAIVHHGGAGTTLTALATGLPQLVLPQVVDLAGERLVATGAAISIRDPKEQDDPDIVADRLRAVLDEPHRAEAAAALRDAVHAMPSPAQLVPRLEKLAGP